MAALARQAVDGGADLLGVAGGDGTQALVAGIAAGRDVPMLVISAGTRNHFALDLGLDRDDPSTCLDALADGVELRIDLGLIGDRTFVNNASFGAYAQVVQSPAYRDDKTGTALAMLPDLLTGHQGPRLVVRAGGRVILDGPQAVLVSNNPYEAGDIAGLGRASRLDQGPARRHRRQGRQRCPGRRPAKQDTTFAQPHRADRARGHHRRRPAADPGRYRRRVGADAHPGALHHPPARAAGAGPPRLARRPRAAAATGLGPAAPPGASGEDRPRRVGGALQQPDLDGALDRLAAR